jgi:CRISPR/Cas system-associated exonuclease Cas4 (RecB family)
LELKQPWSYSALTAFETCPRRFQLTRVTKEVSEPQTEATLWGNKIHKALELYAKGEKPLPPDLERYGRYVKKIMSYEGKRVVEQRVALNRDLRPTKWMAKDVWVRGVIDIGVVGSERAYLLDWKTGARKPDSDQLKLFAALAFATYPWIDSVVTGFVWLKVGKFDKEVFTRDQVMEIWTGFHPRLERLALAYSQDRWVAKPSGLCRSWCPVGKKLCEFCGT